MFSALMVLLVACTVAGPDFSGRITYLTLDRRLRIEVNGMALKGEILRNGVTAIVTRRDAGNEHSYLLSFEGDIDFTGKLSYVVDCHEWVAPHLLFLIETRSYPPCKHLPQDGAADWGWPLCHRNNSMQFVTKDHSTITIARPD
jgi:hypothetical protein